MEEISAPERTREELRALMNGDLGTAAGRGDLVRLALRLIVEEALPRGEVADVARTLRARRWEKGRLPQWLSAGQGEDRGRGGGLFSARRSGHAQAVHLRRTGRAFGAHAGA